MYNLFLCLGTRVLGRRFVSLVLLGFTRDLRYSTALTHLLSFIRIFLVSFSPQNRTPLSFEPRTLPLIKGETWDPPPWSYMSYLYSSFLSVMIWYKITVVLSNWVFCILTFTDIPRSEYESKKSLSLSSGL